jgi:hypothetical protein
MSFSFATASSRMPVEFSKRTASIFEANNRQSYLLHICSLSGVPVRSMQ